MNNLKTRVEANRLERAAYILKCVAHPVRINIIDLLEQEQRLTVSELQEALQVEQSLLSHHLTNMRDKGVLNTERKGKNMYYSLTDANICQIIGCINGSKIM